MYLNNVFETHLSTSLHYSFVVSIILMITVYLADESPLPFILNSHYNFLWAIISHWPLSISLFSY